MSDEMAYVVVEGAYDYNPIQVFAGEGAQAAANQLALDCGDGATVKALPIRPADWAPGSYARLQTELTLRSASILSENHWYRGDFSGEHEGKSHSEARLRPGRWVITTTGDGAIVPEAHAAAVAAKREEITRG